MSELIGEAMSDEAKKAAPREQELAIHRAFYEALTQHTPWKGGSCSCGFCICSHEHVLAMMKEKVLALLDTFAAEGIARAILNTLHNIHREDCEVFTQAKALTCKCLQRRVSDAEAQLEKLKAERRP